MAGKSRTQSIINGLIIVVTLVFCLSAIFVVLALELDKGAKKPTHTKSAKELLKKWVATGEKRGRANRNASSLPGFPDSIPGYNQVAESVETTITSRTYIPIDGGSIVDSMTASIHQYGADTEAAEAVYQLRYTYIYDHQLFWMKGTMSFYGNDHSSLAVLAWSQGKQLVQILVKAKPGNHAAALINPLLAAAREF